VTVVEIKKYSYPEGPTYYLYHGGKVQIFQNYPTMEQRLQQVFNEQQQPQQNNNNPTVDKEAKKSTAEERSKSTQWLRVNSSRVTVDKIECGHCHVLNSKLSCWCRRCHTQL
jgi:hypothetical protein